MNALFVAWRSGAPPEGWRPVGRLEYENGLYRFCYTQGATRPPFHPFPQMGDLDQVYESNELFPVFDNRLLSKNRPEYDEFLRWGGFDASDPPEPMVILALTQGIRQTDAIEVFPCPQPDGDGCYLNRFFLHRIRWVTNAAIDRIADLHPDDELKLMPDIQNQYDQNAIAVRTEPDLTLIGYIPRYLARDVWTIFSRCDISVIQVSVERINRDAPLQNRLLCRMTACWPDGFVPCSGEDFEPIPATISSASPLEI